MANKSNMPLLDIENPQFADIQPAKMPELGIADLNIGLTGKRSINAGNLYPQQIDIETAFDKIMQQVKP